MKYITSDWLGTATALTGSLLLSLSIPMGWGLFVISNIAWIWYAKTRNIKSMLYQQLGFSITTCIGLAGWLVL